MNIYNSDILCALQSEPFINQRILAEACGHSLGIVNRCLKDLQNDGLIDEQIHLTDKALKEFKDKSPKNAVILAAGFGMRMVPINAETSKGLLEVNGEPLIERIIKQLHEVNIKEIYIVVGFMKEQYEYLIDKYNVELLVNPEYSTKNNLHSLKLALNHLANTYVIPCDIWCDKNPFSRYELYSWYMVSDLVDDNSSVRVNRKMELVTIPFSSGGNAMIGISYLTKEDASIVRERVLQLSCDTRYDGCFWEETLYQKDRMFISAKVVSSANAIEINTYEQLREIDSNSNQLKSNAIAVIAQALHADANDITDISVLKKGMTNRSFLFSCNGEKYIMRIPGEGTAQLINRAQEAEVYHCIKGKGLCDDVIYINPANGYKITRFLKGARNCDPLSVHDLERCMKKLRSFHETGLTVKHEFNIWEQIDFYESLWNGQPSAYKDYFQTKQHILSLKKYIDAHVTHKVLTHIDAVPDNFIFYPEDGTEALQMIDWEYAGMQDPHVDIAMFCIYALYNKRQIDRLIQLYFTEGCSWETQLKIYCYIAACGLLWSNWCEYKRFLGVDFGEYSLKQYRYAKEFYKIAHTEIDKLEAKNEL